MEKFIDCVENTLDYAEISTVIKIDNKTFFNIFNSSETKSTQKFYPQSKLFKRINLINIMLPTLTYV